MTIEQRHLAQRGIFAVAIMSCAAFATAAEAQQRDFNVPAQPATTGVAVFARQADVQLLITYRDAVGKQTNSVSGTMPTRSALQRLLAGTGLVAFSTGPNAFSIVDSKPRMHKIALSTVPAAANATAPAEAGAAPTPAPVAAPPAQAAPEQPNTDIIVTATRRAESIQKVPTSITAFNAETIRQIGATNVGEVLKLVPGVSFQGENTYRPTLTVRGIQGSNEDAAIAMYVDGVYLGHDLAQNMSNLDPESVQVLRGPQGALYGKNTLGGAIIITSKRPTFDTHASLTAGYGMDNFYNVRGSISTGIVPDKVAMVLSAYITGHDGYFFNEYNKKPVGSRKDYGARGALLFQPIENLSITLHGDYSNNRYQESSIKSRYTTFATLPGQTGAPGYNTDVSLDIPGTSNTKLYGGSVNIVLDAEPFTVTSVTAARGYNVVSLRDFDSTGIPQGSATITQKQHQYSQEFTLTSSGQHRFNWIAGVQLYHEVLDEDFHIVDNIGNLQLSYPAARTPVVYDIETHGYTTNSYAIYAQADYRIFDKLKLAAGLRYALDDRRYLKTEQSVLSNPTAIGVSYSYPQSDSWHAFIPEASLTYEFSKDVSLYGKFAKSYRPGGFNVNATFNRGTNEFGKEAANSYEIGLRTRFLDRRVNFNVTAFRIDWKDQQVSYSLGSGFVVANVNSRSQGIELDARAAILSNLNLTFAGTYLDATYGNTVLNYRDPITRTSSLINADGYPLSYAPKWSGSAALDYKIPMGDTRSLLLRTDVSYKSSQYLTPLRADLIGRAITYVNARAEYDFGKFSAAVYVKNALNRLTAYVARAGTTVDAVGLTDPRTYGFELGFKF
ncbi:MAG: TonB-dependent receptor [Bradyrhizobium sp.]|nr:TonB-dependent receptor [Bradyrhizobium sp.]